MKHLLLTYIITVCLSQLYGQSGVNISPTQIPTDPSAILNVQSQNQGVLLPRTTTGSIINPADGLIVFDTVLNHYMFYDQNQWTKLLKASAFAFYYADRDGDGHGDPFAAIYSMTIPFGYVSIGDDCNDNNPATYTGNTEVCDQIDNDCDALIDEGFDQDGDGYTTCEGDCNDMNISIHPNAIEICNSIDDDCDGVIDESPDNDMDGYTICQGDCNDNNTAMNPGQPETCDGLDNNCNGLIDEGYDQDGDGYTTCEGDCNDMNISIHPNATEICNGIDDDCDGQIDEGYDQDGDGYTTCEGDCNDMNISIHPNAIEICNGIDDDCDGQIDEGPDLDGDGFTQCGGDCDDSNPLIHPGAIELCDGIDNDCDSQIDENCGVIAWCNLQFPPTINTTINTPTPNIFGQVYSPGVTEALGQGTGIMAQVGYGADGSDPAMGGWVWTIAAYNVDVGNNDEYVGQFTTPGTVGNYDYAYRFSGDGGATWTYGDLDGSANGYSAANAGQLTVL